MNKTCKTCKKQLLITDFSVCNKLKGYRRNICKRCRAEKQRKWFANNRQRHYQYKKNYQKNNPKAKLIRNYRRRLYTVLKSKKLTKRHKCVEYLGCEYNNLKTYLENKFKPGMNWDNYGMWHIDHIKPLSSAKTEDQLKKLCHYTNLQPLWAKENLKKGNRW